MRRVLIWSILTAIVAVILIGVGYWAYWNFFARFQPVTITQNQAEIQRLLDEASWVSEGGGGQPVYVVGWRDSAAMDRYLREEAPRLKAGGAELQLQSVCHSAPSGGLSTSCATTASGEVGSGE